MQIVTDEYSINNFLNSRMIEINTWDGDKISESIFNIGKELTYEKMISNPKYVMFDTRLNALWMERGEIVCEDDTYYFIAKPLVLSNGSMVNGKYHVFIIDPPLYRTKLLKWHAKNHGMYLSELVFDWFTLKCYTDLKNNNYIDVVYTKCCNRHNNNVTITTIKVKEATNKAFLKAIEKWKANLISEIIQVSIA